MYGSNNTQNDRIDEVNLEEGETLLASLNVSLYRYVPPEAAAAALAAAKTHGSWQCQDCTLINEPRAATCEACSKKRPMQVHAMAIKPYVTTNHIRAVHPRGWFLKVGAGPAFDKRIRDEARIIFVPIDFASKAITHRGCPDSHTTPRIRRKTSTTLSRETERALGRCSG
jgi:hypothetical protein